MKTLSQDTIIALQQLGGIDLFSKVGELNSHVRDWNMAAKEIRKRRWRDLEDAVINFYNLEALKPLREKNPAAWDYTSEVDQALEGIARRCWDKIKRDAGNESPCIHCEFVIHFRWICLEAQHPEELSLRFFSERLLPVYESGHFPCGWKGESVDKQWMQKGTLGVPSGELVIF
ncbi:MAG: hypothetical protein HY302_15250 [Opitutae bacterium]|nr:hypothetical protein [Opitutae bacterium]